MQILQIYISMVNTWINKSLKKAPVFARSCTAGNCANDAEAYLLSFLCEFTEWSWRECKIWNSAGGMHTMWLDQCTLKSTVHSVELHTYLTFYTFSVWTIIVLHHLEFCALNCTVMYDFEQYFPWKILWSALFVAYHIQLCRGIKDFQNTKS